MPSNTKIVLATGNAGKVGEFTQYLTGLPIDVLTLRDFPGVEPVDETGTTFRENAILKAAGYATQTHMISLADDSGLEVDALGGRPGVQSARYGGPDLSFEDKMRLLMEEVNATRIGITSARFVCSVAIASSTGEILAEAAGVCEGHLAPEPRGSAGFGYDPLFIPSGFTRTFGELPGEAKHKISHRGRAFEQIIPFLRHLTGV